MNFTKMHGAGNDFIILEKQNIGDLGYSNLAKAICNRHFGVGSDGLMIVDKSDVADVKMIFYNADGSIAEMCGNGIRCFSKYVYDNDIVKSETFTVETLAGIKKIKVSIKNDEIDKILVEMGKPSLNSQDVPVKTDKEKFINEKIIISSQEFNVSSILMGVPHTVIFVSDLDDDLINKIGPIIEKHDIYPKKTNVNFVKILSRAKIIVNTWERGVGRTLACGTGVCASVYIAKLLNFVDNIVEVEVPGGTLNIYIDKNDNVFMEGRAEFICSGKYYYKDYLKNF
ncbi:diaminopimelate epimerase [Caminicella sporogenes DSM 14501]|uniref:Diaminopimelate epimerase n=1 Tax=Caminicella sporogenes DSM 14501 TaxID=1121266 RepID=A0A1M6LIR4_9FIRM|nr:diaminopimelate epimerase [Caminicella sporogenes]RKD27843.1 diaminopimelate epimerase [Caminicella sporogenes]WIF94575.1 diaminopimelate epimerase [Caminicella sporogenes]SHJ71074.1 diaminopimelate epimerase [Caminicella sporogenes DSM 14501]